jgi:hypothetical protein
MILNTHTRTHTHTQSHTHTITHTYVYSSTPQGSLECARVLLEKARADVRSMGKVDILRSSAQKHVCLCFLRVSTGFLTPQNFRNASRRRCNLQRSVGMLSSSSSCSSTRWKLYMMYHEILNMQFYMQNEKPIMQM